ncbi:MAG: hypothetical protein Fur0034_12450 [Desulfuromonadia bacterium]
MDESFSDRLQKLLKLLGDDEHKCRMCGRCCEVFGGHLHAYESDIQRWRRQGREDLLAMVNHLGWIWCDPETGALLDRCPFIQRLGDLSLCGINDTKPQICRDYPPMEHGKRCIHKEDDDR